VDLQEWPDREEDTRQIASSLGWAKCAVQSNSQNPGAQAFLALHARYLAVVKERDDLQRTNDTLAEIIGGEETAETKNYEIVDVAELQAQLAASEAARGRMREALISARAAIKGREHTGFIDAALAEPKEGES
jgi:hypothetical protein